MVPSPIAAPQESVAAVSPAHTDTDRRSSRLSIQVVLIYFLVLGIATVMLGPTLPLLAARWQMPDAQLGTLFLASFAGQFCGAWLATPRVRASLILGAIAAAFGLLLLTLAGPATAHLALFCAGLGLGAGMTAGNVIVGAASEAETPLAGEIGGGSSRSRNLALLNVAWGIGAIACPVLLDASLRLPAKPGQVFFAGLAIALAACAALIAKLLPRPAAQIEVDSESRKQIPWTVLLLFGATLMLYVGVENALAGWLPTYAQRVSPGASIAGKASSIALCFWTCELAARGITALVISRVNERLFYRLALLALLATVVVLVLAPHPGQALVFALTALAAISLAPLFPLAVSFLLARTGNHPRIGKVFACATLGGTLLPWLTGVASTHFATLRIGFMVPAAGAALLLLLSLCIPARRETTA
jgi:fucose permease